MSSQHSPDGLSRQRLRSAAVGSPETYVCSIVAPAGFGKSTLCRELVARHEGVTASVTAGSHLQAGSLSEQVRVQLARSGPPGSPVLIMVDDAHLLEGSPAESDLREIVDTAGPSVRVVLGGRMPPPVDLQPFRLENHLCELDAEDLRFRSWEVEELFTTIYGVRMPPSELTVLTAATEGWAAGLQLYRHAIKRSSASARLHQLKLLSQSRLATVRTYLAMNVLDGLDETLRQFALRASVLGHMHPKACNRFLGRIDSERCLDRLVEMQLFTTRNEDGVYRFHEVFRSFLEGELIGSTDPDTLREMYLWAGRLLEEGNATADAIRAYTMAGSEDAASRLLTTLHYWPERPWVDAIPDGLLADPRLRLARARVLVRAGRPSDALAEFTALAHTSKFTEVQQAAQREADRLRRWIDPQRRPPDPADWMSVVRSVVGGYHRDQKLVLSDASPVSTLPLLVSAVSAFLAGELIEARRLSDALDHSSLGRTESTVSATVTALVGWLVDGTDPAESLEQLRDEADRDHLGWTTRLLRALLMGFPGPDDPPAPEGLRRLDEEAGRGGDPWTPAVARLALLLGLSTNPAIVDPNSPLIDEAASAVQRFRALGADSLAVWAIAVRGLVAERPGFGDLAPSPGERAWAETVHGRLGAGLRSARVPFEPAGVTDDDGHRLMRVLYGDPTPAPSDETATQPPTISLRLFGAFEVVVGGLPVPLNDLRPRARSVLRFLALHVGSPVHRESILEAMWPEVDPTTAGKRLHVAISSIRHQLGTAGGTLVRSAEAYQLGSADRPVTSDLDAFDRAVRELKRHGGNGPVDKARSAAQTVLSLYAGELLIEEGPATWVVREREERLQAYLTAVRWLVNCRIAQQEWDTVTSLCRLALRVDRYQDELWRAMFTALESAGRTIDLERAKLDYDALLLEMSITLPGAEHRMTDRMTGSMRR